MAKNDIENIDDLFSDAILGDDHPLDAYGNPFEEADDASNSDDDYIVLDADGASSMFDPMPDADGAEDGEDGFDDFADFEEPDAGDEEEPVLEIEDRRNSKSANVLAEAAPFEERKERKTSQSRAKASAPEPAPVRTRSQKGYSDEDASEVEVEVPDWVVSMRSKLLSSVAHAFLLSGNVRDYMVRDITITDGIVQVLDPEFDKFDIIAEYDQAHGLSFYGDEIELEDGGMLADLYRKRFLVQMKEAQEKMSLAVTDDIPNRDPVLLFTVMSYLFDHKSEESDARILLFIDYSDFLVPDASAAQMKPEERKLAITLADIGRSQRADEAGNCLIFITDDATQLSTRIRSAESRIEHIKIPIPEYDERADFIENVLDVAENTLSDGTQIFEHPESIDKGVFAVNTAGLSRMQIEDIVLRSLSEDEPLSLRIMKDRKNDIIREDYDDVLEIVDPDFGFKRIGGMDMLKSMFQEEVIDPIHAAELEAVPMGILLMGPPGTGKSVAANFLVNCIVKEDVLTGRMRLTRKRMGDLVVGDYVFNRHGKPVRVLGVYPQGELDAYEVTIGGDQKLIVSADHLWGYYRHHDEKVSFLDVTDTKTMIERGTRFKNGTFRFRIPKAGCIESDDIELPMDPYVFGAFAGDGCHDQLQGIFSSKDEFIVSKIAERIGASSYSRISRDAESSNNSWQFGMPSNMIEEYAAYCREIGRKCQLTRRKWIPSDFLLRNVPEIDCLACDKSVPEIYLRSGTNQRLETLQGLMDTDGSATMSKSCRLHVSFSSTSKNLAYAVRELALSLGYNTCLTFLPLKGKNIRKKQDGSYYQCQNDAYEVTIKGPTDRLKKLFSLPRKIEVIDKYEQWKNKNGNLESRNSTYDKQSIYAIEPLGKKMEMVCIKVDDPEELFIANDYVVTHNTVLCKAVAHEANMNFVALNLNRIMEKWVGSTERNLDRALECAMAMAPTIIFIDEIDEALPNRADPNQTAVNKRINQRLLTFFSDQSHKGEVMILAATNYPEKVDPAFKRAGRFDMRFPMFAPDEFDRMRIMQVIAKARGYEFSWFESPDKEVANPFGNLRNWLEAGNVPVNEKFVGDRDSWSYTTKNALGQDVKHEIFLPKKLISIIDKKKITLQQFYEAMRILFEDLPVRTPDASTGEIETDEVFFQKIRVYLGERTDVIGNQSKNIDALMNRAKRWELIYKPFSAQTFQMTGAELDVVMNKAITLWKRWTRSHPDGVERLIEMKAIKHDRDIPWNPFLLDACRKTVNAVAGIKLMEDNALLNTSDLDFIPDAMYAETDDGRQISYHERQEELVAGQTKAQLKKDKNR